MKKLTRQIVATVTTGTLMFSMLASTASAATITITNSTNGRDSQNSSEVNIQRNTTVNQVNDVKIKNDIDQDANTGENQVKDNLGGVEVTTGAVTQESTVTNEAGSNAASLEVCDCDFDVMILNEKNGRNSENNVELDLENKTALNQFNDVYVKNDVDQKANTGENQLKDNNSDDEVSLTTGGVDQDASVSTSAGLNQAALAGGEGTSSISLTNSMNGRDSQNNIELNIEHETDVNQVNEIDVENDVDQDANTGENDLKDNLGGAEATTGDIDQNVVIINQGGANALEVASCLCDVDVEILNEKNGRDSENNAELTLGIEEFFGQFNEDIDFENDVEQDGDTGENTIADNNSDDMNTGSVDSDVEVHNSAGLNSIGEVSFEGLDWDHDSHSILMLLLSILS